MYTELDREVLQCFVDNQSQLFPEGDVVFTIEEAKEFLEETVTAVVVDSVQEVGEALEELGYDAEYLYEKGGSSTGNADEERILEAAEVFDVGDGRYLIVVS